MNFVIDLTLAHSLTLVESLWLSGGASELGIRRSGVRFLMEIQNYFFLCLTLATRRKATFSDL